MKYETLKEGSFMKKVIALLLAFVLLAAALSGCTSIPAETQPADAAAEKAEDNAPADDNAEPADEDVEYPVIKFGLLVMQVPQDLQMVQDELCKITRREIGCDIELIPLELGTFAQKVNLLVSGGDDAIDIVWCFMWSTLASAVANGQVICLDDLMEKYGYMLEGSYVELSLEGGRIGGKQYGIPRYLGMATHPTWDMDAEMAEKIGLHDNDEITLEQLTEYFKKIREIDPDTPLIATDATNVLMDRDYAIVDADGYGVIFDYMNDTTVESYFHSAKFDRLVGLIKEWKELGAFMPDALNNTEARSDYFDAGKAYGLFAGHYDAELDGRAYSNNGRKAIGTFVGKAPLATNNYAYCITTTCKHPEEAFKLLCLMAQNKEFEDLIVQGIEGVHYVINEDGLTTYPEGVTMQTVGYAAANWAQMNCALCTPPATMGADYYEKMIRSNDEADKPLIFGFTVDMTPVNDELTSVNNAVNQYLHAILVGAVDDIDGTVEAFRAALDAAGMDKIIAEEQRQLDEWLAANGK